MKKQYAVIGLGRFGYAIARTLSEFNCEVIAIDRDEDKVNAVADFVVYAVQLDAMDEKALRSVGVQNVDAAIVSIGENIEASILVAMRLKEIGINNIIAKAVTDLHGKVLEHLGVNRIIFPERDMAVRVAHSLTRPAILEQLELSQDYSIVEIPSPKILVNKSLQESKLRSRFGVNLIAVKRKVLEKEEWNVNPKAEDVLREGDILVVIGSNKDLDKLGSLG